MPLYPPASATLTNLVAADGETGGFIKDSEAGNLPATSTNDNAAAGKLGEYISATVLAGSAVALTTDTAANIASISLTAGDWDVSGNVWFQKSGGTTISYLSAWVSTASAAFPTLPNGGAATQIQAPITGNSGLPTGTTRLSLAETTTVYLGGMAGFSVSTLSGYGFIGARRVR